MSIFYDVVENLRLKKEYGRRDEMNNVLVEKLSFLGGLMLAGRTKVTVELETEGTRICFSGKDVDDTYKKIINSIRGEDEMYLRLAYAYDMNISEHESPVDPFYIMNYIDFLIEEIDDDLKGLSYHLYEQADCAEKSYGYIVKKVYNEKENKIESDLVKREITEFPEGRWTEEMSQVMFNSEFIKNFKEKEIREVCDQLAEFALLDEDWDVCDNDVWYYLNQLCLSSKDDFERFVPLMKKFMKLTEKETETIILNDYTAENMGYLIMEFDQENVRLYIEN